MEWYLGAGVQIIFSEHGYIAYPIKGDNKENII